MTADPAKARLTAKSNQAWDDLEALLKEHVPAELHGAAYQRMDVMHGTCYSLAFEDLRILTIKSRLKMLRLGGHIKGEGYNSGGFALLYPVGDKPIGKVRPRQKMRRRLHV